MSMKRGAQKQAVKRRRGIRYGKRWGRWMMRAVERDAKERAAAAARVNAAGFTLH